MSERCIVAGCRNHKGGGHFVGDLCAPCHTMLVNGEPRYGKTFVHQMRDRIEELDNHCRDLEAKLAECEARLSKAVDIDMIEQAISDVLSEGGTYRDAAEYVARTTLAELKGANDAKSNL